MMIINAYNAYMPILMMIINAYNAYMSTLMMIINAYYAYMPTLMMIINAYNANMPSGLAPPLSEKPHHGKYCATHNTIVQELLLCQVK